MSAPYFVTNCRPGMRALQGIPSFKNHFSNIALTNAGNFAYICPCMQSEVFTLIDILGTAAFAISGVFAAMEKRLDIFGIFIIAFITAIPDVADATEMLADFVTRAPENYPRWSDPAFDTALARGDAAAAELRLLEAAPLSPLYFNTKIWLMSPRVRGWQEDGLWSRCYQGISLEPR